MIRTRQQIHDEWLVLRCQSGQAQALTELLGRWHQRLFNHARKLVRNEADAADALQEALIAIARFIRRLEDPALFGPWAHRILAHKCADATRRRIQRRRFAQSAADRVQRDVRAESPADAEDIARVRLAIDQLSIEGRAILVMRYGRDMSTQTIAAALGIREGTVKSRLHHARNEVKSILERSTQ